VQTNGRQIQTNRVPPGTPAWGAKWKTGVRDNYLSTVIPGTGVHGSFYSYRDVISTSTRSIRTGSAGR
jgi:gluconate 2-dehydrogenase alpha chain